MSGSGSATSISAFTVSAAPGAPTISSFTPALATVGVPIRIAGANFSASLTGNTVNVAATPLTVQAAAATSISSSAPQVSGSGHISVQTAFGQAVSAGDLFFVPAPYVESNVVLATRLTSGASASATFSATRQIAIILFDGLQGQSARLLINSSAQNQAVAVYDPAGAVLLNYTTLASNGGSVVDTPVLPSAGTYAIFVKSDPNWQGAMTLTLTTAGPAGDFLLTGAPDFNQNSPAGPAFQLFVNAGTGPVLSVALSASGLPACAAPVFSPSAIAGSGTSQLTFTLSGCAAGSYPFTVTGNSGSFTHSVSLTLNVAPLPAPWSEIDIDTQNPGHTDFANGVFSINGFGAGILFATDAFHFDYQQLSGDGSIVARVVSLYNTPAFEANASAYGGVMIRETLTDTSNAMYLRLNSLAGAELQWRTTAGGTLNTLTGPAIAPPYWLKLVRAGASLSAFVSPDAITWTQVGSSTAIAMANSVSVGLTSSANPFGRVAQAVFDNVTVSTAPDFSVTESPAAQTIVPTATASYAVSITAVGGFAGTVALSATGLPAGATATFTPNSITGSGASTLAISTSASTPIGTYTVTLTGASGVLTHSIPLTLIVGAPDFSIAATPSTVSVPISGAASYTITVTAANGFTGAVGLSATGLAPGATLVFNPTNITGGGTSTVTVTVAASTPARTYQLTFTGISGSLKHSTTVNLTVTPTDFGLALDTAWMTFAAGGGSAVRTVTITTANGFAKTVTLSANSLPAGATASFNPPTVTASGTSLMTVTLPAGAGGLTFNANLVGTVVDTANGSPAHSVPLAIVQYTSGALPAPWTNQDVGAAGVPGAAGYSNGSFTVQGSGADIFGTADAFQFVSQPLSGDATIIARLSGEQNYLPSAKAGVMIRETPNAGSANASLSLTGGTPSQMVFLHRASTGAATNASFGAQASAPVWVKLVRQGSAFTGFTSADGYNWGNAVGSATISMASSAYFGFAVSAQNNSTIANATFDRFVVSAGPDFYLIPIPGSRTVGAGGITTYETIRAPALNGLTTNITMSITGLPAGATYSFVPASVAPGAFTNLQINIPAGVAPGSYSTSITGTAGAVTHSVLVPIVVSSTAPTTPSPWSGDDLGVITAAAGSSVFSGNAATIQGAGGAIDGSAESFRYTYQALNTDGTMIARLTSWTGRFDTARAGLMIRENLSGDAVNACACLYADVFPLIALDNIDPNFQYRPQSAAATSDQIGSPITLPQWLRLDRLGNTFTGFASSDGVNWNQTGQVAAPTMNMAAGVFAGLAVSSGSMSPDFRERRRCRSADCPPA